MNEVSAYSSGDRCSPTGGVGACELGISVWVVDDRPDLRQLIRQSLHGVHGLDCCRDFDSAESLLSALEEGDAPDVILLDNNMGGMSGLEAIRPVRKLAPDTRVLMLTTFFDPLLRAQVLEAGAHGFLVKSAGSVEISLRIHEAVRHGQVRVAWEVAELAPEARKPLAPPLLVRILRWVRGLGSYRAPMPSR